MDDSPGFEPGSQDSKSWMLATTPRIERSYQSRAEWSEYVFPLPKSAKFDAKLCRYLAQCRQPTVDVPCHVRWLSQNVSQRKSDELSCQFYRKLDQSSLDVLSITDHQINATSLRETKENIRPVCSLECTILVQLPGPSAIESIDGKSLLNYLQESVSTAY